MLKKENLLFTILFLVIIKFSDAQQINWSKDGNSFYRVEQNQITKTTLPSNTKQILVTAEMITLNNGKPLEIRDFSFSKDHRKILLYTNTKKVWRLDTEGDYWLLDLNTKSLSQIGKNRPTSSLRFAKLSPDASKVAYVSEFNLYVEDIDTQTETALTTDGNRKLINGTFDWAYEEEFACRDGFQWSPDSNRIAFWQIDARKIRDYNMINLTDDVYSKVIPVEYPTAGQTPSPAKIGVIEIDSKNLTWLNIAGDPSQHYLPRIEWNSPTNLFVQQLNRKQNESKILNCNVITNTTKQIYIEKDTAWIDVLSVWENSYGLTYRHKFPWINNNKEFLWFSEKDGWRHLYRISTTGKATCITKGDYDVMDVLAVNEQKNLVYFYASPNNATQKYLYRTKLNGKGKAKRVTPLDFEGTHNYSVSPTGKYAFHSFSNTYTKPVAEFISLPNHTSTENKTPFKAKVAVAQVEKKVEFFKVTIADGTEMDGWMIKPTNFDASKKYPVVFMVYAEPWGANVKDQYGIGGNRLYKGNMADDGYIYMSIDNRGTPAPKGRAWRKAIYRNIGKLNISDQAMAAKEVLTWDFVDAKRVAVWGWSGGGSTTLNLLFKYPKIYQTGIAIAAVGNQLTYDNIYQERYMGLPQENIQDFINGSPITHAKNLEGNLLYIHGTGDDNVHYNNAEMLINELIKHNKQFQLMAYPNRSHSISEGAGTSEHLQTLYTNYLKQHCLPGGE
ncbi:DPP IV N-terminal domain-containing protein [Wenyingzhuangia sp. chi5]|uniref:DPP IV N-terminal domain-containing protein n=1 Tax=Wenyingzhuangia gilva TaxID=3057677 RepID=A0ABT8VUP8_9FLAO|nr:DPP IV N-terminal domain-containing protein [Wenyingzhuangia sp. chi5]MDO3695697.1 DPP IV N-terminal domain-containing protein [Wenyingzhuangia sp. chi5]